MRDWDNTIGFLFHDVARFRSLVYDHFMQPHGLTRAQWRVLGTLFRKDGLTQRQLCDRMDIGAVTLSGLIDRLEARGWVERREDPSDRRVKRIWITDQVRDVRTDMVRRSNELNRMSLKGLNTEQIDQLIDMMKIVKGNLTTAAEEIQENKNGAA
ncbi:MAG: MarR family transcriptional regulator [Rhodospirillaceae bacterium]|jgi:MarR family transcriptional regulator, transcriptional regulator for hemolysin|nr:MarR family transcriptional regulator [Rhodospirillaceae bacterium]